jgi:hypothetical protein
MKYSQQALDENKAAEEELKTLMQNYLSDMRSKMQNTGPALDPKPEEPVLPLAEAQKQVDDEVLKQANELVNKYRNTDEYPMMDNKRFAKTKQYLNKL